LVAQFDIAQNLNSASRGAYPLLLILQHDQISSLQSVVVAPLVPSVAGIGTSRLHPVLEVSGRPYVVKMEDMAATPRGMIGAVMGSAMDRRYDIVAALDLLFTGI
jgi:toxin CcdB